MDKAFVRGAGLATCLGADLPSNLTRLRAAIHNVSLIELPLGEQTITLPYCAIADPAIGSGSRRIYVIVERVVNEALEAAGLSPQEREASALFIGSSSFEMGVSEELYARERNAGGEVLPLRCTGFGRIADRVKKRFGLRGASYTFNTACSSSANAVLYASSMIEAGWIKNALVIGLEAFNATTLLGFHGLNMMSQAGMRPFDPECNGLVLGEGCGALVLGAEASATTNFRVRGGENLCDTHSITAANPDGSSIAELLSLALAGAGLATSDIRAIKAHGTATELNDQAEAAGILSVFGQTHPPISCLKPYIGHTLGACGINELILFCAGLDADFLVADPGICESRGALGIVLNQEPKPMARGAFLLNYFGFGGNNTVLILSNEFA